MADVEMQLDSIRNYNFNVKNQEQTSYLSVDQSSAATSIIERDLIYQKLNEKNSEKLPTQEDSKSVYSMSSDKNLAKTGRPLCDKVIIKTEHPYDSFASEKFAYMMCKRIVTVRVDDETFTYLNNPQSDDYCFYLNIDSKLDQYELINQTIYDIEVYKRLNLPYEVLSTFTKDLNTVIKTLPLDYMTQRRSFLLKNLIKLGLLYLLLVIMCLGSFLQIENIFNISKGFGYALFIIIGLYVLLVTYITYRYVTSKELRYMKYKLLLSRQTEVENFIDQWCSVRKYRTLVIVPTGFQYIQFCYSKGLRFFIENHEITDYV
jgi:hypothetical protein